MLYLLEPWKKSLPLPSFTALRRPIFGIIDTAPPLMDRGNRDLQLTFEPQLNFLIFFHLEEHPTGRHLLQVLAEDDWARKEIDLSEGIQKSGYVEAMNTRGVVGYRVGSVAYWVATDGHDRSAEDLARLYKLCWQIEIFFGWWQKPPQGLSPDCQKPVRLNGANPWRPHSYP